MPSDGDPTGAKPGHDWLWDEGRIDRLLHMHSDGPLFAAGCAPNMGTIVPRFDRIVLLHAPIDIILTRVRQRTGNGYGKAACEAARIVENTREVEPRLRRIATHEFDATAPLDAVVGIVLRAVGEA